VRPTEFQKRRLTGPLSNSLFYLLFSDLFVLCCGCYTTSTVDTTSMVDTVLAADSALQVWAEPERKSLSEYFVSQIL